MKKDDVKTTYIFTINFKKMSKFKEKPYFPVGNENNI